MKHAKKIISGFIAMSMALPIAAPAELLSVSNILTVKAADQVKTGKTSDGYDFELWNQNGQGQASMDVGTNGGFTCSWSNIENALFRTGKKLGSTKKWQDYNGISIQYDVDYQPMGNSYMCVYGWTEDPTVEYYIVEAWGDWRPPGMNNSKATISSDGKTYDLYTSTRVNQPSIHGTETFEQYWSVNKTNPAQVNQMKNLKGTISVSDHFAAWEKAGMRMGKMYEVALNIEGYRSSGKANVKQNKLVMGAGTPGNDTTPQQPVTTEKDPEMTAPAAGSGIATDAESSAGGWTARGESVKIGLTGAQKHDGSKSIAVTGRTASWNGIQNSSSELKAGGTYTVESYVTYSDSSYATAGFTLGLQYKSGGETQYDNITDATASAGKWAKLGDTFTVPAGATDISLYIQTTYSESDGPADMINFYVDDISITGASGSDSQNPATPGDSQNPEVNPNPQTPASSDSLRGKFANCFKLGTSVSPNELNSGADFIKKHFNSITPENELKPDALLSPGTDNTRAKVSLQRAAATLKFCEDNGISLRGHTFVWYSQTPDWFFRQNFQQGAAYVSKDIMNQRLENFIKDTFEAIAAQYPKLDLYAYDVCNELFINDGGGLRPGSNSGWTAVYGDNNDEFIINAFTYARKYAPKGCKLYINDYNEYIPAKTDDIYNIAMKLKEKGIIDGIGMQSHLATNYPSASVYKTGLEKFLSTGLEVQITELDIETKSNPSARAKLFADVFQMAVDHADQIPALTVWGTHDDISWRRSESPLLFTSGYKPKDDYTAVMSVDTSKAPVQQPTQAPTQTPVQQPTQAPTQAPAQQPTQVPTQTPVQQPTQVPTQAPVQQPTQAPAQDQKPSAVSGDVDANGSVNSNDVVSLMHALIGKETLSSDQKKNADLNGDGIITIIDLIMLKNKLI